MSYYFQLKYKIIIRHFHDLGIHPVLGFLLSTIVFIGFSELLFNQFDEAAIFYALLIVYYQSRYNDVKRNDFLKSTFSSRAFFMTRMIENISIAMPGIIFLLVKHEFQLAAIILFVSLILSRVHLHSNIGISLPTPFSKKPFEFSRGVRRSAILLIISYFIFGYSFFVANENIGLFSLILLYVASISFYSESENEYYVWIFSLSPKKFIFEKFKTSILHSSLLVAPQLLILILIHPDKTILILGITVFSLILLFCIITMKYSEFPGSISISQGIIFIFCAWFPPLLLGIIPYYYSKSIKNLTRLLR